VKSTGPLGGGGGGGGGGGDGDGIGSMMGKSSGILIGGGGGRLRGGGGGLLFGGGGVLFLEGFLQGLEELLAFLGLLHFFFASTNIELLESNDKSSMQAAKATKRSRRRAILAATRPTYGERFNNASVSESAKMITF
jgi:hypothetical protein